MTGGAIDRLQRRAKSAGPVGSSEIYQYLKKHHAKLLPLVEKRQCSWTEIAAEMGVDGLRGATGNAPERSAVRKVWVRVCRDLSDSGGHVPPTALGKKPNRSPRSGTIEAIRASAGPPEEAVKAPTPFAPLPATPSSPDRRPMTPQEVRDTFRRGLENRSRPVGPRSTS